MRWLILTATAFLVLSLIWAWLVVFSGRANYLIVSRDATIMLNGTRVPGRVLNSRATAIVTTLRAGKEHSYELLFAGDTDFIGNMGNVVDCHEWVAPHLPVLLRTRNYPPCVARPEDGPESIGWRLNNGENGMQFVTWDGQTIATKIKGR